MRRRAALLLSIVVLGAGLALPGAAVAGTNVNPESGYVYRVVYNYCSGGAAYMKVKEIAKGWTPANGLTVDMYAQEYRGGRWRTVHHFAQQSYSFAANGVTHYLKAWSNWYNAVYPVRLKFKLRVWAGAYVVAHKNLVSRTC